MFSFNRSGFLYPAQERLTTLDEFEAEFVLNIHRHELFKNYKAFIDDLKDLLQSNFVQWVDGSFVTKKLQPNDIDVVTFIPTGLYRKCEPKLINLKSKYQTIDAYFVEVFDSGHPDVFYTESDRFVYIGFISLLVIAKQKSARGFLNCI